MDKNKIARIALVIKTDGLEYDDRVRKEILTIQKLYKNISFKIFVMLNGDNTEHEGVTSYGVPYKVVHLESRDKYKSAEKLLQKAYEFYAVIKDDLKSFDAVWCADVHCFMVPALVNSKRIVWDLHELPYGFIGSKVKEILLRYIFSRCKLVIHANPQRFDYLQKIGLVSKPQKHYAIRNFPNFEDVDTEYDELYSKFVDWRKDKKCIYLQGLNNDGRAAYESISAVLRNKELVAVVVGNFDEKSKERLQEEYGEELESRIFFAGKIAQLKIPQYVAQCYATLVFYKNIRPNNFYCEANRFYQSVIMGLPVVVGNNPPMKELVEQYNFGVSIDNDGSDIDMIEDGLTRVINNYDYYKSNIKQNGNNLIWEKQEDVFKKIIEKLFE